ncbi:MAG: class I SAM-dependent methyltransferase [Phycisphaerae bacterium]
MPVTPTRIPPAAKPTSKPEPSQLEHELCDSVCFVGQAAGWFQAEARGDDIEIAPTQPLPSRCTLNPVALFEHDRGFFDINCVMGRLMFASGTEHPQRYAAFTNDSERRLRDLFIAVQPTPDDTLLASPHNWRAASTIVSRLCERSGFTWTGLSDQEINKLMGLEPWLYPMEGCALHAVVQQCTAPFGPVIEVGSLRGQSTSMLALGLASLGSDAPIISIDPHIDVPSNHRQVRTTLEHIDEAGRLIQIPHLSERAAQWLRPESASMVFIDGDHEADAVAADFYAYAELLTSGGFLLFHDYGYGAHNGRPDVVPGVRPTVDHHVFHDDRFEPLMLAHTLMVFRKK